MSLGNSNLTDLLIISHLIFAALNFSKSSWIVIGFGLDCQSNLKSGFGFGFSIIYLDWIWIGLTIQKNWIEQYPVIHVSNFQTREVCLKSLVHESKVLNAILFRDVIIAGCQFGLLVFWDLNLALKSPATRIDFNDISCIKILVSISPTKS